MRSRAIVVLAVLSSAVVTGGWLLQRGFTGHGGSVARARLFDEVMARLEHNYVDSIGERELYVRAAEGMLRELHDPHSVFLEPKRLARLTESTTGNYGGLGIRMDVRDGLITVVAPLAGSPAERAGVETGDRVVEIDGKPTRGLTDDEALKLLRGAPGSTVSLLIERPGQSRRMNFTLTRQEIHRSAVQRAMVLGNGVGYLQLTLFSDSTERELSRTIDSLSRAGMSSLILDLRGNPGGLLSQGVQVAELFLDPGKKIVSMHGRTAESNHDFVDGDAQRWPTLPLVVLVNEGSASASEIVAGALQDHDRALVVGRTSYGKGSAQTVFPIDGGGALKLTTARWYTPVGRQITKVRPVARGEDPVDDASDSLPRKTFKTDMGRTVYSSGGITPDLISGDTATTPMELALQTALGRKVPQFRDAMTEYALALRSSKSIASPEFSVTPEMRDALWKYVEAKDIPLGRAEYDSAAPLVSRLLGYEVARYVFGPIAEARRIAAADPTIRLAETMLRGQPTQRELFARAASHRSAARADD
jgi:carboxyl-terminal processing protease